jgi:Ca-activated chloride channel homolog
MRLSVLVFCGLAYILPAPLGPRAQPTATPNPSVVLYVTVTDQDQRLVSNLTREDFEIYEDGKLRTLTSFEVQAQPLNVIALLDTSGSMMGQTRAVVEPAVLAIDELLKRLSPQDKALVGNFNDKITIQPAGDLTGDVQLLRSALRTLTTGYPTRLYDAVAEAVGRLGDARGRRAITVLTDGDDTASKLSSREVIKRATAADVSIYVVGIVNTYFNGRERVTTNPGGNVKKLCTETGGAMVVLKDSASWGPAFVRLTEELHTHYVIGFTPQSLDRKQHKLDVKVSKAGLTARTRRSYLAAGPSD